ncbi:hypothetical protein DFH27DRAFT_242489 [Peziza echinospora]|nr:hypothetical protein DFH27DRAFT_242489 [Peziza echinospora]
MLNRKPTTSFLDQDHSAKPKKQRKKKVQPKEGRNSNKPNSPPVPKPVSVATKKKLDAFAFQKAEKAQQPTPADTPSLNGKENDSVETPELVEDIPSSAPKDHLNEVTPKKCPQTPAPRIALKDLVRISEDGEPPMFAMAPDVSPEERILWQVSPRGTPNPASQITPLTKRQNRLKRAKSSSPTGSPRATPIGKRHPVGGLEAGKGLKTPQADPANDVWQRYSSTSRQSASAGAPAIPRLFAGHTASSLNLSPLGLRRSYSCGADWPLLGAQGRLKRRKIGPMEDGVSEENQDLETFMEESEQIGAFGGRVRKREVKSRLNRVSMLLDKVHENLAKGPAQPNIPDSSSPLRGDASRKFSMPSSPTKSAMNRRTLAPITSIPTIPEAPQFSDNDEYDDFDADIDMDMLDKVEEVAAAYNQRIQPNKVLASNSDDFPDLKLKPPIVKPQDDDFDEFDDGADDLLDDVDVDNLLTQYDQRPTINSPTTPIPNRNIPVEASDVVAEFGDIDFGDWDDEELDGVM